MAVITHTLLKFLKIAWQFINLNKWRFVAEVVVAVISYGVGYGINQLTNQATLQACQDERTELLRQNADKIAAQEAVKYAGIIAGLQTKITEANEKYLLQKQQNASDSIQHLTELEAVRAINRYITGQQPGNTGIRPKR